MALRAAAAGALAFLLSLGIEIGALGIIGQDSEILLGSVRRKDLDRGVDAGAGPP